MNRLPLEILTSISKGNYVKLNLTCKEMYTYLKHESLRETLIDELTGYQQSFHSWYMTSEWIETVPADHYVQVNHSQSFIEWIQWWTKNKPDFVFDYNY